MNIFDLEGAEGIELMLHVQRLKPDVLVLDLLNDGREPGICSHLLEEFRDLVILAISPSKIRRLSKASLLSFSERALLETIRAAVGTHPLV
jgi:hypothetical protein